jgi:D-xylose transport system permease protein
VSLTGPQAAASLSLGALVIGSNSNGMGLLALSSSVKFMITGAVLLVAPPIDALSRRGRQAAGGA